MNLEAIVSEREPLDLPNVTCPIDGRGRCGERSLKSREFPKRDKLWDMASRMRCSGRPRLSGSGE